MSFQAYLDAVQTKTGKTVSDFRKLADKKGLQKSGEIVAWLKEEFGLGHGHAQAVSACLKNPDFGKQSADDKLDALFSGTKTAWKQPCVSLIKKIEKLGADVEVSTNQTYVNLNRGKKKFATLQPSSAKSLDVGIKLKGVESTERLEAAGSWNNMVTHRVRIGDAKQLDAELLGWIKQAYEAV